MMHITKYLLMVVIYFNAVSLERFPAVINMHFKSIQTLPYM